jgi:hypothetical protein
MTMTCGRWSATTSQTWAASNSGSMTTVLPVKSAVNVGIIADVWISGGSITQRIAAPAATPPRDCWNSSVTGSPV